MKPQVMRDLQPGAAIGAQKGFCETFNWIRRFCENLSGGPGITIDRADGDHPIVKIDQDLRLAPFTVEWHDDHWAVYVPDGSVAIGNIRSLMVPEEQDSPWYRVVGSSVSAGTYQVFAHVKGRVCLTGETDILPGITVTMHAADPTDAAFAGDIWNVQLGVAKTTDTGGQHEMDQVWSGSVDHLSVPAEGLLELFWDLAALGGAVFTPYVTAGRAPYLGTTEIDDTPTVVTGDVYYKVDCCGSSPVPGIASAVSTSEAILTVKIYEMSQGRCIKDLRASLASQVFYP